MHLAEIVHSWDAGDVRGECDAARSCGVHHPEPPRDDGTQTVSADDDASANRIPLPASRIPGDDTGHSTCVVNELLDLHSLAHLHAGRFRGISENRVEARPRECEAERLEAAHDAPPARCDHFHAGQLCRRCGGDRGEDILAQALEHARRFGTQIFRTGFLAREARAVEQQHTHSRPGEKQGSGRSCRPSAGNDNIPASAHAMSTAQAAPESVAARFTASLSIHRTFPCTVAPSRESTSMPTTPARAMVNAPRCPNPYDSPAINPAPAIPPVVPRSDTPPSVPVGTGFPVVINRGGVLECLPISVAHVSAVAAANAPANNTQAPATAASAATPPFARTCL